MPRNRNGNLRYKKGNVVMEVLIILVVLMAFGLTSQIGFKALTDINSDLQLDNGMNNESKAIMQSNTNNYTSVFDGAVVFILFALTLAAVVFAYSIDTNPVFFTISIILLIIIMFVAVFLANPFIESTDDLGTSTSFPKTTWIYEHLLTVVIIQGLFITVALYMNSRV